MLLNIWCDSEGTGTFTIKLGKFIMTGLAFTGSTKFTTLWVGWSRLVVTTDTRGMSIRLEDTPQRKLAKQRWSE